MIIYNLDTVVCKNAFQIEVIIRWNESNQTATGNT